MRKSNAFFWIDLREKSSTKQNEKNEIHFKNTSVFASMRNAACASRQQCNFIWRLKETNEWNEKFIKVDIPWRSWQQRSCNILKPEQYDLSSKQFNKNFNKMLALASQSVHSASKYKMMEIKSQRWAFCQWKLFMKNVSIINVNAWHIHTHRAKAKKVGKKSRRRQRKI